MMNYSTKAALTSLLLVSVISCGGGGGGGSSDSNLSVTGRWAGSVTKVNDSCAQSGTPLILTFTHSVSQNGDAVTVIDGNDRQYLGNIVGGNGFSVDNTDPVSNCSGRTQIEYDQIDDSDDNTASIDIRITKECTVGNSCQIAYTGTAAKNGATSNTPVPSGTSSASPTPTGTISVSGGCAAINPRPAAGTYGGDGGCGISDAKYSVNGSTVVLEPFGANGATSFLISSTNTASATSSNVNLSIASEEGYTCSMVCSPPGTFTVSCFKEGGTSCIEKF